jgi:hypothetical protein
MMGGGGACAAQVLLLRMMGGGGACAAQVLLLRMMGGGGACAAQVPPSLAALQMMMGEMRLPVGGLAPPCHPPPANPLLDGCACAAQNPGLDDLMDALAPPFNQSSICHRHCRGGSGG